MFPETVASWKTKNGSVLRRDQQPHHCQEVNKDKALRVRLSPLLPPLSPKEEPGPHVYSSSLLVILEIRDTK